MVYLYHIYSIKLCLSAQQQDILQSIMVIFAFRFVINIRLISC